MTPVTLPAPPSANALFVWRDGKRVKTGTYRKWLRDAAIMYRCGFGCVTPMPNNTPLRVTIEAAINRTRDLDNSIKPLLDSLQAAGVIPDDRWVDEIDARRVPAGDVEAGWCRVSVGNSLEAEELVDLRAIGHRALDACLGGSASGGALGAGGGIRGHRSRPGAGRSGRGCGRGWCGSGSGCR